MYTSIRRTTKFVHMLMQMHAVIQSMDRPAALVGQLFGAYISISRILTMTNHETPLTMTRFLTKKEMKLLTQPQQHTMFLSISSSSRLRKPSQQSRWRLLHSTFSASCTLEARGSYLSNCFSFNRSVSDNACRCPNSSAKAESTSELRDTHTRCHVGDDHGSVSGRGGERESLL